jgi:hypothetical protein
MVTRYVLPNSTAVPITCPGIGPLTGTPFSAEPLYRPVSDPPLTDDPLSQPQSDTIPFETVKVKSTGLHAPPAMDCAHGFNPPGAGVQLLVTTAL